MPLVLDAVDSNASELSRLVDSPEAAELLADMLAAKPTANASAPPSQPVSFDRSSLDARAAERLPTQADLRALSKAVSVDYAALTFAQRLMTSDGRSRALQAAFDRFAADGAAISEAELRRDGGFPYTVLFAPGWLYLSHPKSGANFADQRALLDRLGIDNRLIPVAESGSIEDNAKTIALFVQTAVLQGNEVILISASKAGAEVAYALANLLPPQDAAGVVAWLNAGGALGGTPLADRALRAPASWFVRLAFRAVSWDWAGLEAMGSEQVRGLLAGAEIPESVAVVNLVAVPVSGSVGRMIKGGYWFMRNSGPTDGVVPLADAVWPGGVNLVALGSDHLLLDMRSDEPGMALMRALRFAILQHADAAGRPTTERL